MPALADLVPGLYVLALGALVALVLRRWYERIPAPALAVFALAVVVLYGPALFAGRTLLAVDNLRGAPPFTALEPSDPPGNHLQGDQVLEIAPLAAEVRRTAGRGEWPLISERLGAGTPLLASPAAQPLQPLVLAAWPLPLDRAAGVTAALRVLVALLFGYLLLARLLPGSRDGTRWAAVAGALAYALGGYLQLWLGWPRANAAAWLPALLYAVLCCVDDGRRRDLALATATVLAVLLGGDHNAAVYALLAAGGLAIVRLRRLPAARRTRPALALLAAAAIAFGLAAPVVLQTLERVPGTPTAAADGERATDALRNDPLGFGTLADGERRAAALAAAGQRLVPVVAANALGNSRWGSYRGPANSNEDAAVFAGTVALLLALCAAMRRTGRWRQAPGIAHRKYFLVLAAVVLVAVAHPPVVAQLLEHLPYFVAPPLYHQRAGFLLVLALAALAAGELDRRTVSTGGATVGPTPGDRWPVIAAAAVLAAAIAALYAAFGPADGWLSPRPWLLSRPWTWPAVQLLALTAAAAVLLWVPRRRRGAAVALLIAAELTLLHAPANPSLPRRLFYPTSEPVELLQRLAAEDPGARMAAVGPVFPPAVPAVYGLSDARARGRLSTLLYSRILAPVLPPDAGAPSELAPVDHPLLDLLGVRWLLTGPKGRMPIPARTYTGSLGLPRIVLDHPAARLWERPGAMPRLFLPAAAEVWSGGAEWPARVAALDDVRRLSLVASHPRDDDAWEAGRAGSGAAGSGAATAEIEIHELSPARLRAAIGSGPLGEERLLASSILQDGGWRLLVDGAARPTVFVNGPFVGAWLPAGGQRIDLLYRPGRFVLGMVLAALALCVLAGWLGRPPRPGESPALGEAG